MQFITYMTSETLATRFLPAIEDPARFMFFTVSHQVKTNKSLPNVEDLRELVPPQYVLNVRDTNKKQYRNMYDQFLRDPENEYLATVLTRMTTEHENMCVILVCSPFEAEYGYLPILLDFLEELYGLPYVKPKKVIEAFEKGTQEEDLVLGDVTEVVALAQNRYDTLSRMGVKSKAERELEIEVQAVVDELFQQKRKKLERIADAQGVKHDKGMTKKKLVKKIALKYQEKLIAEIQNRPLPTGVVPAGAEEEESTTEQPAGE